jgi:hypothetical protein
MNKGPMDGARDGSCIMEQSINQRVIGGAMDQRANVAIKHYKNIIFYHTSNKNII